MTNVRRLEPVPEIVTKEELAEILRVSEPTIDRMRRHQGLPCVRYGRRLIRFEMAAVRKWMADQDREAA